MFITMHCGGMAFDGNTIKEKSLGGSETAALYMAKELAALGHKVTLFTNMPFDEENEQPNQVVVDDVKYISAGRVSKEAPMGAFFHSYAEGTPCDVLIIQRNPAAFNFNYAAKIKLLWLHDLALVRNRDRITHSLKNITGILTVSEYHKKQVVDTWGLNPDVVHPITNGVDLSLFDGSIEYRACKNLGTKREINSGTVVTDPKCDNQFKMLYSSRPERGLEHLVRSGGIMERLLQEKPEAHLYVCAYDNVTQHMVNLYNYLWKRCNELPNVTLLGSLTKKQLADVMRQCDLHVYPTEFEEVSCITMMEDMAAGLPVLTSNHAALPETTHDNVESGTILIDLKDGKANEDKFVEVISTISDKALEKLSKLQHRASTYYTWENAANRLMLVINDCFESYKNQYGAIARELLNNSDIYALQKYLKMHEDEVVEDAILKAVRDEFDECYDFMRNDTWYEHYQGYYKYEANRGVNYGPENLAGNTRFECVSDIVSRYDAGSVIIDYGCAHGHYTVNLAKRFPHLSFIGIDITKSNIKKAKSWAEAEGIKNVQFLHGYVNTTTGKVTADGKDLALKASAIIAAEVLEHVGTPQLHADILCKYLKTSGEMIITTPFGKWEAEGYREHYPWRAHVHHFERADLHDMWGHNKDFTITVAPSGASKQGELLGSYITTFKYTSESRDIDYERKLSTVVPYKESVSLCMIVRNGERDLLRALEFTEDVIDEVIIGIDNTTDDNTVSVIESFMDKLGYPTPVVTYFFIDSPLKTGFDEARNTVISKASGDWVMWIDADEVVHLNKHMCRYFTHNQFDGYAVAQHHYTIEPKGILKTDYPCRIFRNHKGIKFYGLVHEHPEKGLNEGVGSVLGISGIDIAHYGYTDEATRRKRFARNINLLKKDRVKYPERILGKYLWLRDLSQLCRYDLESNGGVVTQQILDAANEGVKMYEEILELDTTRYAIEGVEFYSFLAKILGNGFDYSFAINASKLNGGSKLEKDDLVEGHFIKFEHAHKLMNKVMKEKTNNFDNVYF